MAKLDVFAYADDVESLLATQFKLQFRRRHAVIGRPVTEPVAIQHLGGGKVFVVAAHIARFYFCAFGEVDGQHLPQAVAEFFQRLRIVFVNASAPVGRNIEQKRRAASDRSEVQIHQLLRRFDAVVFLLVPEPTRTDRNVAFRRTPDRPIAVAAVKLFFDAFLTRICPRGSICAVSASTTQVDVRAACQVLSQWDRRGNNEDRGAQIWDEFWEQLQQVPETRRFTVPFDPAAPLDTPRGLSDDPAVAEAFAAGVLAVQRSGIPLDDTRGDYQFLTHGRGARIPLPGGCGANGYFTVVCSELDNKGAAVGSHGNSYLQVVQFTAEGVEPYTLLLPSQSTDPASEHSRDYTRAYSQKAWLRAPFTEREIQAQAVDQFTLRDPN